MIKSEWQSMATLFFVTSPCPGMSIERNGSQIQSVCPNCAARYPTLCSLSLTQGFFAGHPREHRARPASYCPPREACVDAHLCHVCLQRCTHGCFAGKDHVRHSWSARRVHLVTPSPMRHVSTRPADSTVLLTAAVGADTGGFPTGEELEELFSSMDCRPFIFTREPPTHTR
jgi:hypothetical protein